MCSGPLLKKLRQVTLGSTFERQTAVPGTAKIAKCQSTYLYYDRTGTYLVISARDPLTHVMILLSYELHRNNLIK